MTEISKEEYLGALESAGMTTHPGGIAGTKELIRRLGIRRGERVIDIGCGTGYTACLMAKRYGATVVAADLQPKMFRWVKKRALREHVVDAIHPVVADAHRLPFRDDAFDVAVIESVLVFCDVTTALTEIYRVLKSGGRLGCNEVTALRPLSKEQRDLFREMIGVTPATKTGDEWTAAFRSAGFVNVIEDFSPIDWLDLSLFTPLRTDGVKRYLRALAMSLADPEIRRISRKKAAFIRAGLMRDLGSGIYLAHRP